MEIHWKFFELWNLMKLGQQLPFYTFLQGKKVPVNMGQI
jgi:hypothetical protein